MASRGINKVILVGHLGQDPEVRYTPSGSAITNINLATSESWKDKNTGQMQEKTEWHRVSFFGKLAEIAGEYLRKGSQVYVEGKLQTRKWQDKQGQDRYSTDVVVDGFTGVMQMLGGRNEAAGGGQFQRSSQSQAPQQQQSQSSQQYQAPQDHQPLPQQQSSQQSPTSENGFNDSFDDDIPF